MNLGSNLKKKEMERENKNKREKFFLEKDHLGSKLRKEEGKRKADKNTEKNVKNAFFQVINSKIFRRAIPWRVLLYWGQI